MELNKIATPHSRSLDHLQVPGTLRLIVDMSWNMAGRVLPMLVALATIPLLIRGMGTDRFGVLMLVWAIIGYFSLFDFGLGRAVTQLVSERRGSGSSDEVASIVFTAAALMMGLGSVGGAVLVSLSSLLASEWLGVPTALAHETYWALIYLAFSLPLIVCSLGLRGMLEAYGRFALSSVIVFITATLSFSAPVVILHWSPRIDAAVATLALTQVLAFGCYLAACLSTLPQLRQARRPSSLWARRLFKFGGWMTLSNLVGPILIYVDRFVIGAMISVAAVAYYATPYEVVTKLWVVPASVCGVLFPAFSRLQDQPVANTLRLLLQGCAWVFLILAPCVVLLIVFAKPMLGWWLGNDFATASAPALRWLAAGVLINSVAQVPFALIQGLGRPDLTAKLHLLELAPYVVMVFVLTSALGLTGAAIAWTGRVLIDAMALVLIAAWCLSHHGRTSLQHAQQVGTSRCA